MKAKELIDLTDDELKSKYKEAKFTHQITIFTLIISILFTIFRIISENFSLSLLYPSLFITIITISLWMNYNLILNEMKARNLVE